MVTSMHPSSKIITPPLPEAQVPEKRAGKREGWREEARKGKKTSFI